jgi:hypothetical protein
MGAAERIFLFAAKTPFLRKINIISPHLATRRGGEPELVVVCPRLLLLEDPRPVIETREAPRVMGRREGSEGWARVLLLLLRHGAPAR